MSRSETAYQYPGFYKEALTALKRRMLGRVAKYKGPRLTETDYVIEMSRRGMSGADASKKYRDLYVKTRAGLESENKAYFKSLRTSGAVPKGTSPYKYDVAKQNAAEEAAVNTLKANNAGSRAAYDAKYHAPNPEKKFPWRKAGIIAALTGTGATGGYLGYKHYTDKAASDNASDPKYTLEVPAHTPGQIAATGLAVPSVLSGAAVHKVSKPLDKMLDYKLGKGFDLSAKQWRTIGREQDPGAVIRRYSRVGNELMNQTVQHQGKLYTAKEVLDQLRSGPHGKLLERAGLNPPYTPESIQHYEQFTKSPRAAYRQLFTERGLSDRNLYDTLEYQKGLRYQAATSVKRVTPQEVATAIADAAAKEKKFTPAARNYLYEAALRDEMRLMKADPQAYNKYLETAAKVPTDPAKYNPLQKQMEDSLFSKSTVSQQDLRTASKRALLKRTGFSQAVLEAEMQKGLQEAADGGYSSVISALQKGKRIRKKARIGRYVIAPGLALAGIGGAYYGLSRPRGTVKGRIYSPPEEK